MNIQQTDKAIIFDRSDGQELRINMISPWLKRHFAEELAGEDSGPVAAEAGRLGISEDDHRTLKIVKLSLDGGFTCPNRDGSKGTGGCCFCSESGSGDMASATADGIRKAMERQIKLLSDKWPREKYNLKFMAYFQNHTNTYGPVEKLRALFETALELPDVVGLAIATRSDCISDEALELLDELNQKTFLWLELGLQTVHDETAEAMNLCHTYEDYRKAVAKLAAINIRVVTHLILGLPGEDRKMMLESVAEACKALPGNSADENKYIFGLKLHMLNVVKGSRMEKLYPDYVPFDSMEEYIDLLIEALELIPPEITMHRISGDAPRSTLIAPEWSYRKRTILNGIHREMRERNTWQGKLREPASDS